MRKSELRGYLNMASELQVKTHVTYVMVNMTVDDPALELLIKRIMFHADLHFKHVKKVQHFRQYLYHLHLYV